MRRQICNIVVCALLAVAWPVEVQSQQADPEVQEDSEAAHDPAVGAENAPGSAAHSQAPAQAEVSSEPDALAASPNPPDPAASSASQVPRPTSRPGQASGIAVPDHRSRRLWVWPLRGLLFIPRLVLEIVDAPIRGGIWAEETYNIQTRAKDIFFNEDGTVGLFPVALLETGFGLNAGLRFVHRDLFGGGEKLNLRASFGGRLRQLYKAKFSTRDRWPFTITARGEYEVRPKDVYFGIGQDIDAAESRFSQTVVRGLLATTFSLASNFSLDVGASYTHRRFTDGDLTDDFPPLTMVYPGDPITGFDEGVSAFQPLVRLSLDTRRSASPYESEATPSLGWFVSGFGTTAHSLDSRPSKYLRVGADVQTYQRLMEGPRVLALRANYDQVIGNREDIPFTDLPRLGGAVFGRGFHRDRFRDKAALLLSAEYQWDLSKSLSAALFVDYGRVAPKAADLLSEFDRYALGGGLALQLHSSKSFLFRTQVATSEEGVFFNLSFDPQFDPTEILRQK